MKILLTNDDGIEAPGLRLLAEVVSEFAEPIVIAPECEMSECSHCVTTRRELALRSHQPGWYAVDGMPVDCVRIGLTSVCPDVKWVLSGVNDGGNLGVDLFLSGTVAGSREGALMGRSAMALSQYRRGNEPRDWNDLRESLRKVIGGFLEKPVGEGKFWNINFPAMQDLRADTEIIECGLDPSPLPVVYHVDNERYRYAGVYAERGRVPGRDVDHCFSGSITATRVSLFDGV